jgi:AraC-like DNA-binding protein
LSHTHPKQTVKDTAFQLGFPTTANFCRYFKRATGIYPQEYKERKIR